jgi:RimJ/RimL family protein N-acetyltransferase
MRDTPEWPGLAAGRCGLRPVLPADYEYLYRLLVGPGLGLRWRLRGVTPTPQDFPAYLGQGVLVQYIAEDRQSRQPVGLVTAYNADFVNGHAFVAMALDPGVQRCGWSMLSLLLFVDHVFGAFNFRKLYFEVPAFNLGQFGTAIGKALEEEGRLRDHEWFDGRYWDRVYLSLTRQRWMSLRGRYAGMMAR